MHGPGAKNSLFAPAFAGGDFPGGEGLESIPVEKSPPAKAGTKILIFDGGPAQISIGGCAPKPPASRCFGTKKAVMPAELPAGVLGGGFAFAF